MSDALYLADVLNSDPKSVAHHYFASAELRRLAAVEAERDALLALIADDAFASSFQTMAQYRFALLKATKGGGNG